MAASQTLTSKFSDSSLYRTADRSSESSTIKTLCIEIPLVSFYVFRILRRVPGFNFQIDTDNDVNLRKHMKNGEESKVLGVSVFTMTLISAKINGK